jgi:hypothetical protein
MQVICTTTMVATHVQSILSTQGVLAIQVIGPHRDDPRVTVMIQQHLSVATEPTIRREIHGLAGTTIVG